MPSDAWQTDDSFTVSLSVVGAANTAPVFTDGTSTTREFPENTAAGINIGAPVAATDQDNDTLTYSLSGTDASSFEIDTATGQIKTKAGQTYDYETKPTYSVTVEVSDGTATDTIAVTISLTDVAEVTEPVISITAGTTPVTEGTAATFTITADPAPSAALTVNLSRAVTDDDLAAVTTSDTVIIQANQATAAHSHTIPNDGLDESNGSVAVTVVDGVGYSVTTTANADTATVVVNDDDGGAGRQGANLSAPGPSVAEGDAGSTATLRYVVTANRLTTREYRCWTASGDPATTATSGTDFTAKDTRPGFISFRTSLSYNFDVTVNGDDAYEGDEVLRVKCRLNNDTGGFLNVDGTIQDDDDTAPGQPDAPTFGTATANSLVVNWTAPDNTGSAITDYDVQYREGSSGSFTGWSHAGTATTATITGLNPGMAHEVQVRATNDEGTGDWSDSGTGNTAAAANTAPTFAEGTSTTREFAENTAANVNIGGAVSATDQDNDTLTYTLGGTDANFFNIDASSGQLKTKTGVAYNYEAKASYSVTVEVSDGTATDSISVTISLTDLAEPPGKPLAPTFGAATSNSLVVNWTAPDNNGPAITDYDVQYRQGSSGSFTGWSHTGVATTATITGLNPNMAHEVQVRAANDEGTGDWSDSGTDSTAAANNAPTFTEGDNATREFPENTAADVNIGAAVSATDQDNDTLTYSLSGTDAASFNIDASSGQLKTKTGVAYNYEAKQSYSVTVEVSDGTDSDSISVAISLTDVTEPPGKPALPTFGAATSNSLVVNWTAPDNNGPAITDYDVQYRQGSSGSFTGWSHTGTAATATITGLNPNMAHEVQVRAANDEGTGDWSDSGTGSTAAAVNNAPVFTEGNSATREFPENTAADVNIGAAVSATDQDNDTLTYSLSGTDAASFNIDASSGQLKTKAGETYDYEAKSSYAVTVEVSDGTAADSIAVTISLTDLVDQTVWAATMTSAAISTNNRGWNGSSGSMAPTEFTYNGAQYTARQLYRSNTGVIFGLNEALPAGQYRLTAGSYTAEFNGANPGTFSDIRFYTLAQLSVTVQTWGEVSS